MGAAQALVRDAHASDAEAIAAIYAHHVLHGTASYDIEPPTPAFMLAKICAVQQAGCTFLVGEWEGECVGYAYATQFRDRAAYRFTCENSIYVHPDWMGRGIGKALMQALMARYAACGF